MSWVWVQFWCCRMLIQMFCIICSVYHSQRASQCGHCLSCVGCISLPPGYHITVVVAATKLTCPTAGALLMVLRWYLHRRRSTDCAHAALSHCFIGCRSLHSRTHDGMRLVGALLHCGWRSARLQCVGACASLRRVQVRSTTLRFHLWQRLEKAGSQSTPSAQQSSAS